MKIAVTSQTTEIDGAVPALFGDSPYLMIIDADKNEIFKIYGKQDPFNLIFAQKVLLHDCEALICGPMGKGPFDLLADKGVTRYNGTGMTVQEAYTKMVNYQLPWITDCIGGKNTPGHHCEE